MVLGMGAVDYVKTPFMACPSCGADPQWESKTRQHPQCEDVTVAELMSTPEDFHGRPRVSMVGDCSRCNYFIEVYIYGEITVDGHADAAPQRAIQ